MIARTWRGATRAEDREEYAAYLERTGMATARSLPGSRGTIVLSRVAGERAEFETLLLFEELERVRAFAGDEISVARFFPEDDRWLVERDLEVRHYDVDAYLL